MQAVKYPSRGQATHAIKHVNGDTLKAAATAAAAAVLGVHK
jgi:hypothetical protein